MVRPASLASLALLALAPPVPARAAGGDLPKEPGVYWESQVEMQMTGFSMPAQTTKVCLPKKGMEEPPRSGDESKCKITDLKRSGSRMTWKMKCQDGTTGEGDITSSPDSYTGTMVMRTQGQEMRAKMKGKKVGGDCDANEMKRQVAGLQKQAEDQQAEHARTQAEQCERAGQEMKLSSFVPVYPGVPVLCKDPSKLCANLETRKGLLAFRGSSENRSAGPRDPRGDPVAKVNKLCGKDVAAIEKKHCAAAAREQEKGLKFADQDALEFVFASCPELVRALAKRECAGRQFTGLPQAPREFCTRWASARLEQPAEQAEAEAKPARKSSGKYLPSGVPDVEDEPAAKAERKKKKAAEEEEDAEGGKPKADDMKSRIMKGIFGR